ncbi:polymer-forming cytoskeletal protein [Hyphomicrobium sp. D-2]|uniref:bactofilin family protein n=1 Tax=Hyphomicrobium sp. D-2 TaxID=3041621 RepID=UPI0024572BE9|nr:polymer-forming cytoskeletal protein [Hyphomicrobium sp. D-2]MDH4982754.1 polymer-forming cytoskeletal protein [Hyphomicrobium sp. D-2]
MMNLTAGRRRSAGSLLIQRAVTIIGSLTLDGQITIEGTVDGEVRCRELIIIERGDVGGIVVADRVVVRGECSGTIYTNELVLCAGCHVEGHIYHRKLVLEEGCYFEGKSRRHPDPFSLAPEPLEIVEDDRAFLTGPQPLALRDAVG